MGQDSVLSHMLKSGEFSDLGFCCNGEEFKVHKAVICEQFPVIKAAIQGGFEHGTTLSSVHVYRPCEFVDEAETWAANDAVEKGTDISVYLSTVLDPLSNSEKVIDMLGRQLETNTTSDKNSSSESPVESPPAACPTSPPTESPPIFSLQKSNSTALFEHVRVNSIGDYYKIDKLVSLANEKIREILRDESDSDDRSWVTSLPAASEEALESTGDEELLNILASAITANLSTVLELDQFGSMSVMSDFSTLILQTCAEKINSLVEEHKVHLRELKTTLTTEINYHQAKEREYKHSLDILQRGSQILMSTERCRNSNCRVEFPCYIDEDRGTVRCCRCNCKHS